MIFKVTFINQNYLLRGIDSYDGLLEKIRERIELLDINKIETKFID